MKPIYIKNLLAKSSGKEIDPNQGRLDLQIDRQMEIQGVGMGATRC